MSDIRYYTDGTQATAANLNKPLEDLEKQSQYMSQAQYESLAEMRRNAYAGSGFIKTSKYSNNSWDNINDPGLMTIKMPSPSQANMILVPSLDDKDYTTFNINGNSIKWKSCNYGYAPNYTAINDHSMIILPEVPTATVETNINSLSKDYKQGDMFILNDTTDYTPDMTASTWYGQNGGDTGTVIISDNGGKIDISHNNSSGSYVYGSKEFNTIKGLKYRLTLTIENFSLTDIYISGTQINSDKIKNISNINGVQEVEFIAIGDKTYLGFNSNNTSITTLSGFKLEIVGLEKYTCVKDGIINTQLQEALNINSISRQDLVFLETWHELIQDKDIVYPYGNIQYKGLNTDGLSGIAEGTFSGAETYSLFGNWQSTNDLVGLGYVWSSLSQEDKLKFASNKDNNIYMSKDGLVQVRYRVRVIQGLGNLRISTDPTAGTLHLEQNGKHVNIKGSKISISNDLHDVNTALNGERILLTYKNNANTLYKTNGIFVPDSRFGDYNKVGYKDSIVALPIALVQRRNQGAFDPVHNPEGSSVFSDGKMWYETSASHNNIIDCFNNAGTGDIASGVSGRPDGLYYDEVNERDIEDLRMSAHKITDKKSYLEEQFNKAVAGKIRGKEGIVKFERYYTDTTRHVSNNLPYGKANYVLGEYTDAVNQSKGIYDRTNRWGIYDFLAYVTREGEEEKLCELVQPGGYSGYINNRFVRPFGGEIYTDQKDIIKISYVGMIIRDSKVIINGSSYVQNNTALVCDIIGDPRTIGQRVTITTTSGDDKTAVVGKGVYVYTNSHYYLSLVDRGADAITVDPDTEDYTNTTNWKDLGTDGSKGGYPQEWKEHSVFGTPLLVGENGESLLPADIHSGTSFNIPMSRKMSALGPVLVKKADGTWFRGGGTTTPVSANHNTTYNIRYYNISSYQDLGYSSLEEALGNIIILHFYETSANNTELTINMPVESNGSQGTFPQLYDGKFGSKVSNNLINKVCVGNNSGTYPSSVSEVFNLETQTRGDDKTNVSQAWVKPYKHSTIKASNGGGAAKFFPYLTKSNSRAQMNLVFKELKWDNDSDSVADAISVDGTTNQSYTSGMLYRVTGMDNDVIVQSKQTASTTFNSLTLRDDKWYTDGGDLFASNFDGNGWGDDDQFQIRDKVSTMQDDNDQTVLYGQKAIKLPNFLD